MAEIIYDLGDLGPFLDVVAWNAGSQGWSFEVKTPWLEGYDLAFNADSSISAGSSPYRIWPYGRFAWSDRLRFGGGGDAAHLVLADRTLYDLPLRNLIFYDLFTYDFSGRRVPITVLDITISETFNDAVHTFRNAAIDHLSSSTGELCLYTGGQPVTADTPATGDLLLTISNIYFGTPANGVIAVDSGQGPYQANAVAAGTAGYGRLTFPDGSVIDGSVATSGAQFNISSTDIAGGDTVILNACTITMPGG